MIPVRAGSAAFRGAVAELPRTTAPAVGTAGAVVALPAGAGFDTMLQAVAEGAVGLVVEPGAELDVPGITRLARLARTVPVVVVRRRLRGVAEAMSGRGAPSAVTAHAAVALRERDAALRDAAGLMRLAAGGAARLVAASGGGGTLVAQIDAAGEGGCAVPGAIVVALRPAGESLVRVTRSAAVRVEAVFGAAGSAPTLTVSDEQGDLRRPRPLESAEREALRRAIEAAVGGTLPADVADWAADERVAQSLTRNL